MPNRRLPPTLCIEITILNPNEWAREKLRTEGKGDGFTARGKVIGDCSRSREVDVDAQDRPNELVRCLSSFDRAMNVADWTLTPAIDWHATYRKKGQFLGLVKSFICAKMLATKQLYGVHVGNNVGIT